MHHSRLDWLPDHVLYFDRSDESGLQDPSANLWKITWRCRYENTRKDFPKQNDPGGDWISYLSVFDDS